jgi:hypothetical protein
MKKIFFVLSVSLAFILTPMIASATVYPVVPRGEHRGEIPPIEYRIKYQGAFGVTTVNASGVTYAPYGYWPTFEPTILPERYFGSYPLYFSNGPFAFTVHLKNTGKRTYRNLLVITAQELLNTNGGVGVLFPGNAAHNWFVGELRPGEEAALSGSMHIPSFGSSGIDQTHLQILHWDETAGDLEHVGAGRVLLDAPQAGLWCPPPANH